MKPQSSLKKSSVKTPAERVVKDIRRQTRRHFSAEDTPEAEKERASREGDEVKAAPFLKRFTVFNIAQCEGLRGGLASDPVPLPEREIVPVAEEVIAASGVDFRIGGTRAFYVPGQDFVQVPPQPAFFEQVNYYRTCLHELTHYAAFGIMPHGCAERHISANQPCGNSA